MTAQSMNRGDAPAVVLPKEVSSEIWADTQEQSAVMRFSNRITLPGAGLVIPTVTGDPTADWAGETEEIAASDSTLSSKSMTGYKLGVIETFSKEFRRDLPALYDELRRRLPLTLANKFDSTVLFGTNGGRRTMPGANFDTLELATNKVLDTTDAYGDIVAIDKAVSDANGVLSGYVLSPKARGVLLSAKDSDGRPLLINDIQREGGVNSLLGVPISVSRAAYAAALTDDDTTGPHVARAETLGFAGDFSNAFYGVVEDISVEISDQASITKGGSQINLWQRDMFAVKVTAHLGFIVRDANKFVRITTS